MIWNTLLISCFFCLEDPCLAYLNEQLENTRNKEIKNELLGPLNNAVSANKVSLSSTGTNIAFDTINDFMPYHKLLLIFGLDSGSLLPKIKWCHYSQHQHFQDILGVGEDSEPLPIWSSYSDGHLNEFMHFNAFVHIFDEIFHKQEFWSIITSFSTVFPSPSF